MCYVTPNERRTITQLGKIWENIHGQGCPDTYNYLTLYNYRNLDLRYSVTNHLISEHKSFWNMTGVRLHILVHRYSCCQGQSKKEAPIQGSILVFSPSCQPGKYARWHTCPGKILLARSIGKNGNRTACKWKVCFLLLFSCDKSSSTQSAVHHICSSGCRWMHFRGCRCSTDNRRTKWWFYRKRKLQLSLCFLKF